MELWEFCGGQGGRTAGAGGDRDSKENPQSQLTQASQGLTVTGPTVLEPAWSDLALCIYVTVAYLGLFTGFLTVRVGRRVGRGLFLMLLWGPFPSYWVDSSSLNRKGGV